MSVPDPGQQPPVPSQYAPPADANAAAQVNAPVLPTVEPVQPRYAPPQYGPPQYAQPQYAQPQYAQPQYAQPQYAQPAPYTQYVRPVTGAAAWALGLIALAFIPFLAAVASCIAMLLAGASARKRGGIAEINGRNAMNWALTYLIATIVLVGGHFVLLFVMSEHGPVSHFFPLGIPITLWAVMTLAHLVFSVVGLSRANSGKTFWAPALPIIR